MCEATVYRTVRRVAHAIIRNMTRRVISWPSNDDVVANIAEGFRRNAGLTGGWEQ